MHIIRRIKPKRICKVGKETEDVVSLTIQEGMEDDQGQENTQSISFLVLEVKALETLGMIPSLLFYSCYLSLSFS